MICKKNSYSWQTASLSSPEIQGWTLSYFHGSPSPCLVPQSLGQYVFPAKALPPRISPTYRTGVASWQRNNHGEKHRDVSASLRNPFLHFGEHSSLQLLGWLLVLCWQKPSRLWLPTHIHTHTYTHTQELLESEEVSSKRLEGRKERKEGRGKPF